MKKEVSQNEFRKYYLSEFELYDGEAFITFNIVSINTEKREIVVAFTPPCKRTEPLNLFSAVIVKLPLYTSCAP